MEQLGRILTGNEKLIGIGSPRASLESNFALRTLVGADRFYQRPVGSGFPAGFADGGDPARGPARTPSLTEIESFDAVLVLGEDVTNVAPRIALALRQSVRQQPMEFTDKLKIPRWLDHAVREAIQDDKGPLFIATPSATKLDDVAAETYRARA